MLSDSASTLAPDLFVCDNSLNLHQTRVRYQNQLAPHQTRITLAFFHLLFVTVQVHSGTWAFSSRADSTSLT